MKRTASESLGAIWEALNRGDLDGALSHYDSEAAILQNGAAPIAGLAAIRDWWSNALAGAAFRVRPEVEEETDSGDVVVLRGRVRGELLPRSGDESPAAIDLWFLQVYRKGADGVPRFWRGASGTGPPGSAEA